MGNATSVIVAGARTPIGRLMGSLSGVTAMDLGAHAIAAALRAAGVDPAVVQHVIMGQVLQAGCGQNPARQAAVSAGIGMEVPALTVNKVCLSSLDAIVMADLMIRAGDTDAVVAGGMESMSQAPHLLPGSRAGVKYGSWELIDATAHDALSCAFDRTSMGEATERYALAAGISRAQQDEVAARSHSRAHAAAASGAFDAELAPIELHGRQGETNTFAIDEGVRPDTTANGLARLRPAFSVGGSITAGNASQISDGAAAVLIMSKRRASELGLPWLAEITSTATVAGPDPSLLLQPANAIRAAADRAGITISHINRYEINEAFAAVAIASKDELGISDDIVNINGGAIALGHPLGASGARIALHLAHQLQQHGGTGAAALCGGGGQGTAIILHA